MADAELGVIIKTEGAEEGADQLDKFSASAKGAADATNDLSQAQSKFTNISGMAPRQPFAAMFDAEGKLKTSATAWANSFKSVQDNVTATGQSVSWFQRILNTFSFDHSLGSTRAFREVIQSLRPALYELNAGLGSTGSTLGGLGAYAGAARAGFIGLAAAITGALIISLEKAGDSVTILRKRLDEIRGPGAGARGFDEIKAAAESSKSSISDMATNVERLRGIMADLKVPAGFVFPDTALGREGSAQLGGLESAVRILPTLSEAFQLAGKSAATANVEIGKFLDQIKKTPFVTKDLFDLIYANSAKLGNTIVEALGGQATEMGIAKFRANIDKMHIPIQTLLQLISQIKPQVDKTFVETPPDMTQSWDRLKTSVKDLWTTLGDTKNGNAVSTLFSGLGDSVDRMNKKIEEGKGFWSGFWQLFTPPQGWSTMMSQAIDLIKNIKIPQLENIPDSLFSANKSTVKINFDLGVEDIARQEAAILSAFDSISDRARKVALDSVDAFRILQDQMAIVASNSTQGMQSLAANWGRSVIDASKIVGPVNTIDEAFRRLSADGSQAIGTLTGVWQQLDQTMMKVANDAVLAGQQMLAAWRSASSWLSPPGAGGFQGGPSFVYAGGGGTGGGGGGVTVPSGGFGPGAYATAGGTFYMGTFYPGKAHGGAFQVSGPGGTDSVPVRFMATPGEVVTITPSNLTSPSNMAGMVNANLPATTLSQGGAAATGGTAPAKAITDPITFAVKDSSGKIVGAVNDATAAIKSMAENAARATEGAGGSAIGGVTGGTGGYMYRGKAGSAAGPLGSGPIDAYGYIVPSNQATYIARINYNSAIAGMPQGPGQPVYAINPNYRAAVGGTWAVQGMNSGTDALSVGMKLTAGELVKVTPPNEMNNTNWTTGDKLQLLISAIKTNADNATSNMQRIATAKKVGDTRPIVINVYGVTNPMAFVASEASIKRAVRRAMG